MDTPYDDRYPLISRVNCLDCHQESMEENTPILAHRVHGKDIQCHVCHAVPYKGCYKCHLGKGSKSQLQFKIGRNLRPEKSYRYTLVRHIPIIRDTFGPTHEDGLPDFDGIPNWKGTSPHNIQRSTYRNQHCNGCHGNSRIFLRKEDLQAGDPQANLEVIAPIVPSKRAADAGLEDYGPK